MANPLAKRIRTLASDRRVRRRESAFVVEGVAAVWRAVDAGAPLEVLLAADATPAGSAADRLLDAARAQGVRIQAISADLLSRLSDRDAPAGVLAVAGGAVPALRDLPALAPDPIVIALNEVANPGNLGTIVRTADCAGLAAVITIGASTDPLSPAAIKASMGSVFDVPLAHAESVDEFFTWATANGIRVITTSARAPQVHTAVTWLPPLAVLLGSEGDGLAPDVISRGDDQVRIPMVGKATSLNLAVAAGILAFEARRVAAGA